MGYTIILLGQNCALEIRKICVTNIQPYYILEATAGINVSAQTEIVSTFLTTTTTIIIIIIILTAHKQFVAFICGAIRLYAILLVNRRLCDARRKCYKLSCKGRRPLMSVSSLARTEKRKKTSEEYLKFSCTTGRIERPSLLTNIL